MLAKAQLGTQLRMFFSCLDAGEKNTKIRKQKNRIDRVNHISDADVQVRFSPTQVSSSFANLVESKLTAQRPFGFHFLDDIETPNELAVRPHLWVRWPICPFLQPLPNVFVFQNIERPRSQTRLQHSRQCTFQSSILDAHGVRDTDTN